MSDPIRELRKLMDAGGALVKHTETDRHGATVAANLMQAMDVVEQGLPLVHWRNNLWFMRDILHGVRNTVEACHRTKHGMDAVMARYDGLWARIEGLNEVLPPILDRVSPLPPTLVTFFDETRYGLAPEGETKAARLALVDATQRKLAIRLPALLRELYAIRNGCSTPYAHVPAVPNPRHEFDTDGDGWRDWENPIPDAKLHPVDKLRTMGDISDDFSSPDDGDDCWRNVVPDVDRLISIASHGWDKFLCLDYRDGRTEPRLLYLDDSMQPQGTLGVQYQAADFATFFNALRRYETR